MPTELNHWNKNELETYILLLCAQSDWHVAENEIALIKKRTDPATFERMSKKISSHTEKESLKKIRQNLIYHHYSIQEIGELRRDMNAIFMADGKFMMKEHIMSDVLQNIIY
jgi:hypothetical protein